MSDALFAISASGMDVERQRLQVIAQNLANAGTTRTATGGPYQPMRLVSGPRMASDFSTALADAAATVAPGVSLAGVQAYGVERTEQPPRLVYDPQHPHADKRGFVSYPGIDHAAEMALMVQTSRVYESNVVMYNTARSMYMRALDLGNRS